MGQTFSFSVLFMYKSISRKNLIFPFKKFPFFVLARNTIMLSHIIIYSVLHYLSNGRLQEVKNKGNIQTFSCKSGHSCLQEVLNDWTCKLLVFWKTDCFQEVVATRALTVVDFILILFFFYFVFCFFFLEMQVHACYILIRV